MPIAGALTLVLSAICFYHASSRGAPIIWRIVVFIPGIGPLIYFLAFVLPDIMNSNEARKVKTDTARIIDPGRALREAEIAVKRSDTPANRRALAAELARSERYDEALAQYAGIRTGMFANDPDLMHEQADLQLASGDAIGAVMTLDDLRASNPDYQSQDAHWTYARALLALDRKDDAARELRALTDYTKTLEPPLALAELLAETGEVAEARNVLDALIDRWQAQPPHLQREQRPTYDRARGLLKSLS